MYIWLEYLTIKSHILFIVCMCVCVCPFVIGELRVVFKSQLFLDFLIIEMETFKRFCGQCLHLVVIWVTCKSIHNMRL